MKLLVMGRQWLLDFAVVAVVYFLLAYVVLPALWKHHEHEPGLASLPMVTRTGTGIPGDPLNVGLVGSREDILHAMDAAGWFPADPSHCAQVSRSSVAWCLTDPTMLRRLVPSIIKEKRSNWLSKSRTAGAPTGDTMSVCGRSLTMG